MGYACPVCDVPQQDGEHLANHLAFTAMLREDEHEAWLDERVPGWGGETPAELADRVTDHAEEAEYDEVFEDTTGGGGHDHDHGSAPDFDQGAPGGRGPAGAGGGFEGMAQGVADEAVESVLQDAQELTEEMYGLDEGEGEDRDADADDEADAESDDEPDEDAAEGNDS